MKRAIFWLILAVNFIGCAHLNRTSPKKLVIEKLWIRNTLDREHLGSRRQHRFQPLIFGNLVIQANSIDGVAAYDRSTAKRIWFLPVKDGVESGGWLQGPHLFFGASDGFLYSVNAENGQVQWTTPIRAEGLSTPYYQDGNVYYVAGNNVLHSVEASSGKVNWVYTRRDNSNLSIRGGSQPMVSGDLVMAGFSDGYLVALKKQNGALVWETLLNRNKRFKDIDAHPVIDGDRVLVPGYDGSLFAINKSDGKTLWSLDVGAETAVTLDANKAYLATSDGEVLCLDKDSGKIIWRHKNRAGISTQPVLTNEYVISGEMNGALQFLDRLTGKEIAAFDSGWGIHSSATLVPDSKDLFVMSAGANLINLRLLWKDHASQWTWERE